MSVLRYCISQLFITIMKYLKQLTYEEKSIALSHGHGGFGSVLGNSFALGLCLHVLLGGHDRVDHL